MCESLATYAYQTTKSVAWNQWLTRKLLYKWPHNSIWPTGSLEIFASIQQLTPNRWRFIDGIAEIGCVTTLREINSHSQKAIIDIIDIINSHEICKSTNYSNYIAFFHSSYIYTELFSHAKNIYLNSSYNMTIFISQMPTYFMLKIINNSINKWLSFSLKFLRDQKMLH